MAIGGKAEAMKYFQVTARCGHVRRHHYVLKEFYVKAENRKDAAKEIRYLPRVQHDKKDAIRGVFEISYEEYLEGIASIQGDPYFKIWNSSMRRYACPLDTMIRYEEANIIRSKKHDYQRRIAIEKVSNKEWNKERQYYYGEQQ